MIIKNNGTKTVYIGKDHAVYWHIDCEEAIALLPGCSVEIRDGRNIDVDVEDEETTP